MKTIYLVTGNPMKVKVAQQAMGTDELSVEQLDVETPEIQSMDVTEIASYSARWAAEKYQKPVVKMDNSFWVDALEGFPGPFVAHVSKTIKEDGIMRLMKGRENRQAKFIMAVAYCEPGKEPIVETSELKGNISETLQGEHGWFSDKFFIPEGYEKPMGSYPDDERKRMWPQDCWEKIARRIMAVE